MPQMIESLLHAIRGKQTSSPLLQIHLVPAGFCGMVVPPAVELLPLGQTSRAVSAMLNIESQPRQRPSAAFISYATRRGIKYACLEYGRITPHLLWHPHTALLEGHSHLEEGLQPLRIYLIDETHGRGIRERSSTNT